MVAHGICVAVSARSMHCYVCAGVNDFIFGAAIPTKGTRVRRAHFVAEVARLTIAGS